MTSLLVKANASALMSDRELSNVTLRTDSSGFLSAERRSEPVWLRRNRASRRSEISSPESRTESPLSSGDRRFRKSSDSAFRNARALRKYYVDQQTGEMKLRSTGRSANHTLASNAMTSSSATNKKHLLEKRWRSRIASENALPGNHRPCWDHSLRTKSLVINSRAPVGASTPTHYLKYPPVPPAVLPRLTRSAENNAGLEIPTRYPRGQQRPTGLASGHQALQERHRQILEASLNPRHPVTWTRHRMTQAQEAYNNPYYELQSQHLLERNRFVLPRSITSARNHYNHDGTIQQRCSQQASLLRSNQKCIAWFDTWVDD